MSKQDYAKQMPEWILRHAESNENELHPTSLDFFKRLAELYPHFHNNYVLAQPNAELSVLRNFNLDTINKHYPKLDPMILIIKASFEEFYFISSHQIQEIAKLLEKSFDGGDFYVSTILSRSILEVSSCSHYILRRVQNKFLEIQKIVPDLLHSKSSVVIETKRREFGKALFEAFAIIHRGNTASGFPWAAYMKRFGSDIDPAKIGKKLHTLTCIQDVAKAYNEPLVECYDIMSEFAHPNLGSKTLLVGTRSRFNDVLDRLTIGSSDKEAKSLWFIDHMSEALYYTIKLALTFRQSGKHLYDFIHDTAEITATKFN